SASSSTSGTCTSGARLPSTTSSARWNGCGDRRSSAAPTFAERPGQRPSARSPDRLFGRSRPAPAEPYEQRAHGDVEDVEEAEGAQERELYGDPSDEH